MILWAMRRVVQMHWDPYQQCTQIFSNILFTETNYQPTICLSILIKGWKNRWKCLLWLNHSRYMYIFSVWCVKKWSVNTNLFFSYWHIVIEKTKMFFLFFFWVRDKKKTFFGDIVTWLLQFLRMNWYSSKLELVSWINWICHVRAKGL